MAPKALYRNRDEFTNEVDDQLVLDTVVKLSKALQNKHHPLFKEIMNQLWNAALNQAAECEAIELEIAMMCVMKIREDKVEAEKSIRDAIAAEELMDARSRARDMQVQLSKSEEQSEEASLTFEEIVQGFEDANAWIKSEKQNIKRVSADIAAINCQIEQENTDWNVLQQTTKVVAVNQLTEKFGQVITVDIAVTQEDGTNLQQSQTIDLEAKRKQLEKANEIPPPGKILALNSVLNENMATDPVKALPYFDLLRDIRVVGAMSADKEDVCDPKVMLALIKKTKISSKVSEEEKERVLAANDLLKQRKAKEAVRERLKTNLATATKKFNDFEQMMLAHKDHDNHDLPLPSTLTTDKFNLFGKRVAHTDHTPPTPKKPRA